MDTLSGIFLAAMFSPGLIRGAFWHDSPAVEGVIWTFATIGAVLASGWVAQQLVGNGLGPTVAMVITLVAANAYAIKGSTFAGSMRRGWGDDIDGDANE